MIYSTLTCLLLLSPFFFSVFFLSVICVFTTTSVFLLKDKTMELTMGLYLQYLSSGGILTGGGYTVLSCICYSDQCTSLVQNTVVLR